MIYKSLLFLIALISVGTHYSGISVTIPVLLLTLLMFVMFALSKKLIPSNDVRHRCILIGLTVIYIASGIVFLLDGEKTQHILEIGAMVILVFSFSVGALWFFTDNPKTVEKIKPLASQAYLIGCLDIGFALLHHWHS